MQIIDEVNGIEFDEGIRKIRCIFQKMIVIRYDTEVGSACHSRYDVVTHYHIVRESGWVILCPVDHDPDQVRGISGGNRIIDNRAIIDAVDRYSVPGIGDDEIVYNLNVIPSAIEY